MTPQVCVCQVNDGILSINGHQTAGLSDTEAFQLMHAAADTVTFVVQRGL